MKPRAPAAPWTLDDVMVWRRFELTIGHLSVWRYVHADRRDADLMLRLGQTAIASPMHPTGRAVAHSIMSWGCDPSEFWAGA